MPVTPLPLTPAPLPAAPPLPEPSIPESQFPGSHFPEVSSAPYVVMAAWQCDACDVRGRSPVDAKVACWNCDGEVTITARPALRLDEF